MSAHAVPTYYAAVRPQLQNPNSGDRWPFKPKYGTPVIYSSPGERLYQSLRLIVSS